MGELKSRGEVIETVAAEIVAGDAGDLNVISMKGNNYIPILTRIKLTYFKLYKNPISMSNICPNFTLEELSSSKDLCPRNNGGCGEGCKDGKVCCTCSPCFRGDMCVDESDCQKYTIVPERCYVLADEMPGNIFYYRNCTSKYNYILTKFLIKIYFLSSSNYIQRWLQTAT